MSGTTRHTPFAAGHASRVGRREFTTGLTAAGLFLPVSLPSRAQSAAATADPAPVVETTIGRIRGASNGGVHVFKGVPYAAPASGKNRFMPPAPREPWTGVLDALAYGFSAPQRNPDTPQGGPLSGAAALIGDLSALPENEDCLVLNVWTRGLKDGGKRPVMFWIHGGGFASGSGSSPGYDGTRLCLRGDVVVVTLNHRLNVLGFSHLGDIAGSAFAQSGNVGMLDIVAALRWVRDNIEQFGGDPGNVMVFGESGGGRKVSTLLAMPAAKGLFHRAAIQSGAGVRMIDREAANKASELLLRELGVNRSKAHELQNVPVDSLLRAYHKVSTLQQGTLVMPMASFAPVVDGNVLPHHPFDPAAPTVSADIPLLIGSNRTEATLMYVGNDKMFSLDEAGLRSAVERLLKDKAAGAIDTYRKQYSGATPSEIYFYIESDMRYGVPTKVLASRREALKRGPTYVYRFDWATPVMDGKIQTPHALEIAFVFDNIKIAERFTGGGADAHALADKMSDAWIAFARSGNPNTPKLPRWQQYNSTDRPTMLFNNETRLVNDPDRATRTLMQEVMGLS